MKSITKWALFMATAMDLMGKKYQGDLGSSMFPFNEKELEKRRKKREKFMADAQIRINKKNGLILFNYGRGKELWALNGKNAARKAKNKGWI